MASLTGADSEDAVALASSPMYINWLTPRAAGLLWWMRMVPIISRIA